ncbi:MAG: VWA domain-containing protein [Candidatus Riflebacteria bacterium]|nr:VWA domain-containing protein [Candidatus Riflebacteria bacterium]
MPHNSGNTCNQSSHASDKESDHAPIAFGRDSDGVIVRENGLGADNVAFKVHRAQPEKTSGSLFQGLLDLAETSGKAIKKILDKMRGTARRSFKGTPRRKTVESTGYGRNTQLTPFKHNDSAIAFLATIFKALKGGSYNPSRQAGLIQTNDFLCWRKTTRESFNLVLIADSSKSTNQFLGKFADIVKRLASYFKKNKDRMGLIVVQGEQARVLHNPTNNYRVVTRSLMTIGIGGETPLASGLQRSLDMIALEKFRKPGAKNLVILISDCAPEPLTGKFADVLEEPSYQACIAAAKTMKKRKIPLIIINPSFWSKDEHYPHERLANLLAKVSGASLIKLKGERDEQKTFSDTDISRIFSEIECLYG